MSAFHLLLRSLRYYWRWHLGMAVGVALAAAVVSGALIVGDSVKETLRRQAAVRIGGVEVAVSSGEGFFTTMLADKARQALGKNAQVAPVLVLRGTASTQGGTRRANGVNVLGVDEHFWKLAPSAPSGGDGLRVNAALAERLGAKPGDSVIIRFEKPSLISRDAPLSGEAEATEVLTDVLLNSPSDEAMGAFSLKAEQTPALNVFVPLAKLQELAEQPSRANLLLTAGARGSVADEVRRVMEKESTLEDVGLKLALSPDKKHWILSTSRVFLDPAVPIGWGEAAPKAAGVLTYLCTEGRVNDETYTAYPMVSALDPALGLLPSDLPTNGIMVSQWTADSLHLKPGDSVKLTYFTVTRARQLEEGSSDFIVHGILPMDHPAVRPELMPDFPGITNTESCRDWRPGIPIKRQGFIRPADEQYWKERRGTPKFFLSLAKGQELWRNRFGELTALWLPADKLPTAAVVAARLKEGLTLEAAGYLFAEPKAMAEASVNQSMDFGMLFLAMSFFLILTALVLAALLFLFNVEHRAAQLGILRATGLGPERVRLYFMGESMLAAVVGAAFGIGGGIFYTHFTLGRLDGDWSGAVAGLKFVRYVRPITLLNGFCLTLTLVLTAVWLVSGRLLRAQPRDLLAGGSLTTFRKRRRRERRRGLTFWLGMACFVLAAGLAPAAAKMSRALQPGVFFGAATLFLIGGLITLADWFRGLELNAQPDGVRSLWGLGLRNAVRRRGRSLAIAGLLASGIFMVVALNTFYQRADDTALRAAGGYQLVGESDLPIYEDLNTLIGREANGLDESELSGLNILSMRQREGEEASCLNLNRAQSPNLLGVDPARLITKSWQFSDPKASWEMLNVMPTDGAVPAIMDQASAMWALGKGLGDTLSTKDARGREVLLRLVAFVRGSVLQGHVLISEQQFERLYPDTGGYRVFFVGGPDEKIRAIRDALTKQLRDRGLALEPVAERLGRLQAVQNTYLHIFSALGGLGLLLSTVGLALLVARNVLERRAEFGLLQAAGFQKSQLHRIVLGEHALLFLAAFVLGVAAAFFAVWPHLRDGGQALPGSLLAFLLTSLAVGGVFFCWLAAWLALRKPLIESIRHE